MKRFGIASCVLLALIVSLLIVRRPQPALADNDGKSLGQLQGIVVGAEGDAKKENEALKKQVEELKKK